MKGACAQGTNAKEAVIWTDASAHEFYRLAVCAWLIAVDGVTVEAGSHTEQRSVGVLTSTVAELLAIRHALVSLARLRVPAHRVIVRTDSAGVIGIVMRAKLRAASEYGYRPTVERNVIGAEIAALADRFPALGFEWIGRDENKAADKLARETAHYRRRQLRKESRNADSQGPTT